MSETFTPPVREADDPEYAAHATGTILVSRSIGPIDVAVASLIGIVTVPLADRIPAAPHERGQEAVSA